MTGRKEPIIMFNLKHAAFLATIVTTLVAACTSPVGPQNSLVKTPSSWGRLTGATPTVDLNRPLATSPEAEVDHKWWKHLDDSTLDAQRASAQVSTTESLIPAFQTAHDASVNRLNVLLGYPPGSKDALLKTTQDLKPLTHIILIAAPAKVLATRPDICAAERRFAASASSKYVAETGWFPNISLTGFFGADRLRRSSRQRLGGLSAIFVQPILNFGQIEAQIDTIDAQQKLAFLNYQQTVLGAPENLKTVLLSYFHEMIRNASLTAGVPQTPERLLLSSSNTTMATQAFLMFLSPKRSCQYLWSSRGWVR